MAEKDLYFIALVPPEPVYSQVMDLKYYMEEHYGTRKALNSPPHITLQMPFKWREDREEQLRNVLIESITKFNSFQVNLRDFDFFEPRVVYVNVEDSDHHFELQRSISREVRHQLKLVNTLGERPFRPHMTIAFRDLKKPMFYEARNEFEKMKFNESFLVDSIQLLKHNGRHWEAYISQPFRS